MSFRQNFLAESVANLENLRLDLARDFSENRRREAFRTIHTIKGGAQTFGLTEAARLANELENWLSNNESANENLLLEGIGFLTSALREDESVSAAAELREKLQADGRDAAERPVFLLQAPARFFKKFSAQEQSAIVVAVRNGKNIFCAEAGFELSDFADRYRVFRQILSERGEVIASLPSEKFRAAGKIGFQVFLASRENEGIIRNSVSEFDAEISFQNFSLNAETEVFKMLSAISAHALDLAEKSGKRIRLAILSSDARLSAPRTKALFDILLHLVRNAVDHAIDREGAIEIRLFDNGEEFRLSVADDGKGIDLKELRKRALEKELISADDTLSEAETLALVFAPRFSTADRVSEISGRGVGLDSVKTEVEKLNGKISVKSRKTNGTIFEVILPQEDK